MNDELMLTPGVVHNSDTAPVGWSRARDAPFLDLLAAVQACRRCPTMEGRRRVLGEANGRPGARVMFIAEAPGRLGGERTGVPLSVDQSGRRFSRMLALAGLSRD